MATISTADKYTVTNKKTEQYSDFGINLQAHPASNDLVRYTNEASIKRSIINLLMTDYHERLFQPYVGANLKQLLFEPMGEELLGLIRQQILACVAKYEPRVKVTHLILTEAPDEHGVHVAMTFTVVSTASTSTINFILSRVR